MSAKPIPFQPDWSLRAPPDSPLIPATPASAGAAGAALPADCVRRMEAAQRQFSAHSAQQAAYAEAFRRAAWTCGAQCGWLGVGAWLFARGYRYADPVQSLASGFTANKRICRIATPLALLGLTICSATAYQLPSDARLLMDARHAWNAEEAKKESALEKRAEAYIDGRAIAHPNKAEENNTLMEASAAPGSQTK